MVLLAKTESEVALEVLAPRVLLERTVKLDLRAPLDRRGQVVTKEMQDPLALKDCRASPGPAGPPGRTGNLASRARRARPGRLEHREAREILVPLVSVGLPEWQVPWDREVEQAPLVPKEARAPPVPLGHPVLLVPLDCKGCLEKEGALEAPARRVTRENRAPPVLMGLLAKMVPGVLLVPSAPLAPLVSLETRAKVVPPGLRA